MVSFNLNRCFQISKYPHVIALIVLALNIAFIPVARAQTYRPSVTIGTASLISPTAADSYYGSSTTHTVGPGAPTSRPPEIVALARALKNSPDLIYEYVRNNIEVVWLYGLQKGSLGTSIDKAGTPFDQAVLMVELLRQAGYTASYQAGTITLTGSQFTDWTGISDASAACQMLSSGGFPAQVNGTTTANCAYGTGTAISSVQVAHIWVAVTISGTQYLFDPSYKSHTWKAGINLASAAGMTIGQPLTQATSGMDTGTLSGVNYVHALNQIALNTQLNTYASNLLTYLQSNNLAASHLQDIVSGGIINGYVSPPGGLRQTSLPYTSSVQHSWSGDIPDQYRTTLGVSGTAWNYNTNAFVSMFSFGFYVDEIYGRALMIDTDVESQGAGPVVRSNTITLTLDGVTLATYVNPAPSTGQTARAAPCNITLVANHPYSASANGSPTTGGDYMDTTVTKTAMLVTPLTIVHGWGDTGPALLAKWTEEKAHDQLMPFNKIPCDPNGDNCINKNTGGQGDFDREKLAASWLAQFTAASHLNANVAQAVPQMHHALGLVYADSTVGVVTYSPPLQSMPITDSFNRVDIDAGISLTSKTADNAARSAALQAEAAAGAALESSIAAQMDNLPDTSSTATRFEWANTPPGTTGSLDQPYEDPSGVGPRKFLQFNAANVSAAPSLIIAEGQTSNTSTGLAGVGSPPVLGNSEVQGWRQITSSAITDYANAGFTVVAAQDGFLGPGQRGGEIDVSGSVYSHLPTKQRGGAFVATLYDTNGNPTQIAHIDVQLSFDGVGNYIGTKGGGGGNQASSGTTYDPAEAADILKTRFVDKSNLLGVNLSNGTIAYTSPASLSVGNGGFPNALSADLEWSPGPTLDKQVSGPTIPTAPEPGWISNWQNRLVLSGSGLAGMGQSDVRAAVNSIVAFLAAQDIYKASQSPQRDVAGVLAEAWWTHRIEANVATITLGKSSQQFLATAGSQWVVPGSGTYATATQTGSRVQFENLCTPDLSTASYAMSRGWNNSAMSFAITNATGDVQNFGYWLNQYKLGVFDQGTCGIADGFRLNSWSFPQGMSVNVVYGNPYSQAGSATIDRIVEVNNSVGRKIDFVWNNELLTGFNNGLTSTNLRTVSLTYSVPNPTVVTSHTDPASAITSFLYTSAQTMSATQRPLPYSLLDQVFTAENTTQANVDYDYDGVNRVVQIKDAVAIQTGGRNPYYFYIADGTRGERDDPLGQAYTVVYDTFNHPWRYLDELSHETDATTDGRGRMLSYLYPEGDCEAFAYDDRNNTTDFWKVDIASACNTGAGSSHVLHASATWDPSWNKPLTVTNARGNTTTLTYYPSGSGKSLLHTATRPTIAEGTPVYSFTYDAKGKPLTSIVPLTTSQTITTSNTYDATFENLLTTILDPGTTPHVNATTAFAYDAQGDVITETDPRSNVTTSLHDNDRRKTEDDHHNGGIAAALNAASRTVYDAVGRDKEDDEGTVFSGTTVTTWIFTKKTTYTPTSEIASITDADSRVTTTSYDGDDRTLTVTDPVSRATHFVYCAPSDTDCSADAVKVELRAWAGSTNACSVSGTLQECYRTVSYFPDGEQKTIADANGNVTTYGYDAFVRPTTTTFPDTSFEQLTLDADGNVTARRNRANETLNYTYNTLDWPLTKVSPSPAVTTSWTYELNDAPATLSDTASNTIAYGYDTAGRQTSEADTIPGLSGAKTIGYTLDANGNRTKLTWPDGYLVNYTYDTLNRMATAADSVLTLATYTYNPLSQRTNLAYGNTASMAYTYTNASDVLTLNHDMSGTANDPHYTFTYTSAHQLLTEANSLSAYLWQPPATASTSYTPNALNEYASVGGVTYGYDAKGNLTSDGIWTDGYDAENRLLTASKAGISASYAYDPLGRRTQKSGTGVTPTFFVDSGSDEIAEYSSSGALVTRYVPGPAIDEPIAMIPAAGVKTYFHTNKQGSVIAMSGTSAALAEGPYTYDPYGNCFSGAAACSSSGEPYRFTGHRFDAETGLYYYRARYYSSALGRFLQIDPVGYSADLDLYSYVGNDPVDRADATGDGPIGWVVKLTEKGLIRLRPLFDKAGAVAARKAGKNVEVRGGRQAAGEIERAAAKNRNEVMRHEGHDLGDDTKGAPHFQTEDQPGHTFYSVGGAIIGGVITILDVIDQLDPTHIQETGCSAGIERCEGDTTNPVRVRNSAAPIGKSQGPRKGSGNADPSDPNDSSNKSHTCTGSRIPTTEPCGL